MVAEQGWFEDRNTEWLEDRSNHEGYGPAYGYYSPSSAKWGTYRWLTCKGHAYRTGETVQVTHVLESHDEPKPPDAKFVACVLRWEG